VSWLDTERSMIEIS